MTPPLSRRQLLALSLAAGAHTSMARIGEAAAGRQGFRRAWGVQLYTVRDQIGQDAASTLKALAAIGYRELEILQSTLPAVAPIARALGLSIVAAHLDGPTSEGEGLAAFSAQAKAHGLRYLVIPFVPRDQRPVDRAGFEQLASRFARIANEVAEAGLQLCYHNHAFEFGQASDGARWLDVLMQATAPSGMKLEVDVFWVAVTGANPIDVIRQYAGRIALLHLKDKHPGTAATLREDQVARQAFVEVGSGALDVPAILAAARAAGVAHVFVEQDHTPGDPVESLRKSYLYLSGLDKA